LQAVRAQRAIACRAPSLSVATTMHHFTLASLMEIDPDDPALEGEMLGSVAGGNLYVASGFAESRPVHPQHATAARDGRRAGGRRHPG
jgi:hypothetical protein